MLSLSGSSRQLGGSCEGKRTTNEMETMSCLQEDTIFSSCTNFSLCVVISVDCFYYYYFLLAAIQF